MSNTVLAIVEMERFPREVVGRAAWIAEQYGCGLELVFSDPTVGFLRDSFMISSIRSRFWRRSGKRRRRTRKPGRVHREQGPDRFDFDSARTPCQRRNHREMPGDRTRHGCERHGVSQPGRTRDVYLHRLAAHAQPGLSAVARETASVERKAGNRCCSRPNA